MYLKIWQCPATNMWRIWPQICGRPTNVWQTFLTWPRICGQSTTSCPRFVVTLKLTAMLPKFIDPTVPAHKCVADFSDLTTDLWSVHNVLPQICGVKLLYPRPFCLQLWGQGKKGWSSMCGDGVVWCLGSSIWAEYSWSASIPRHVEVGEKGACPQPIISAHRHTA